MMGRIRRATVLPSVARQDNTAACQWIGSGGLFKKGCEKMLCLTRKREQRIMIGDDIEIVLLDITGPRVRLGIEAPKHIPVHRKEVYEAIQRAKKESEKGNP